MTVKQISLALFVALIIALVAVRFIPEADIGTGPSAFPGVEPPAPEIATSPEFWVRSAVTGTFGIVALFVILSKRYASADKNWSYGIAGAIVGYWLTS